MIVQSMVSSSVSNPSNCSVWFYSVKASWVDPNGITVDFKTDCIFSVDARLDFVASSDFGEQNLHKLTVSHC